MLLQEVTLRDIVVVTIDEESLFLERTRIRGSQDDTIARGQLSYQCTAPGIQLVVVAFQGFVRTIVDGLDHPPGRHQISRVV